MEDKWHNPIIANYVAIGFVFALPYLIIGYHWVLNSRGDFEILPAKQAHTIQTADLNNNGIPERFYTIDDKIALIEVDGEPVAELLKR